MLDLRSAVKFERRRRRLPSLVILDLTPSGIGCAEQLKTGVKIVKENFMSESMKRRILVVAGTAIVILAAIAAGATLAPAGAANSINPLITTVACNDSSPCLEVQNTGSGRAIFARAKNNTALVGRSQTGTGCPDPAGLNCRQFDLNRFSALRGEDVSTPPPGSSRGNFAAGVFGKSQSGFGVAGMGVLRAGVVGDTLNPSATTGITRVGVAGVDDSNDGGSLNEGVYGLSLLGVGADGETHTGTGTIGNTDNPSATTHFSSLGVIGSDSSSDGGVLNIGVLGMSNGTGISAVGFAPAAPAGKPQTPALAVTCANGGAAIVANTGQPHGDIMSLDCEGNLILTGGIATDSTPLVGMRTASGVKVAAFVARQAQQAIEDFGEAQVINGRAFVGFDAAFASTINKRANYLVFITPEGITQGTLCVVQRTSTGFAVRENQGGRSTVTFAYRILAQPLDASSQRLPLLNTALHQPLFMGEHARVTPSQMLQLITHGHARLPTPHAI
jgi:hypothetical protein